MNRNSRILALMNRFDSTEERRARPVMNHCADYAAQRIRLTCGTLKIGRHTDEEAYFAEVINCPVVY